MCGAALADGQETARRLHGLFGCARREAQAMNELIMGAIIVGAVTGAIALVALLALRWF
jgi:hypothetical protein